MRHSPLTLLLAALLAAPVAGAGTITVTPGTHTVETSRFLVQFDMNFPEVIRRLIYKDWSPGTDLSTDGTSNTEFWGETYRGGETTGFILPYQMPSASWQVVDQSPQYARLVLTSQSTNQPPIVTTYQFFADQPYFTVDRTIQFSAMAETTAYQPYLPRLTFNDVYHALRWRTPAGALIQRGFCLVPCVENDWDGRWLQQVQVAGRTSLSVTSIFPASMASGSTLVRGYGPYTSSGWVVPQVANGVHNTDETSHLMLAFSLQPDSVAAIDALWTLYNNGHYLLDAPPAPGRALSLAVSPNPGRASLRLAWSTPRAGPVTLDVLDVAGRRIVRLVSGEQPAGEHELSWNGVGEAGGAVAPGLYFARLVTPDGTRTARWVRAY